MHARSLSEEIKQLDKKDFTVKNTSKSKKLHSPSSTFVKVSKEELPVSNNPDAEKKTYSNLPQVRKVAIAKRRAKFVMLVALFVSCFSLSVFVGFIGPFLLFK